MNRSQKKCLFAVAGMHLLLVVILIVGPAFLVPSRRDAGIQPVDFIPYSTIDALMSGGGSRNGGTPQPPAPQPRTQPAPPVPVRAEPPQPAPKPAPAPVPIARAEPVRTAPPVTNERESWATQKPKTREVEISKDLVTRKPEPAGRPKVDTTARDRQLAQRREAQAVSEALNTLRTGMSGATHIDIDAGPGGGGPSYANFNSVIIGIYQRAWEQDRPSGIPEEATAVASVTIARDGTVLSARIIQSSGNPMVDRSVERLLQHVTVVAPLPEGTTEDRRTVTINFTAKPEGAVG